MLLSCDVVVAMLAVRDEGQFLDVDTPRVGLAGAVELAWSVEMVGMALDDLILR